MISLPCDSSSVSGCSAVQWRTCSQVIWIFQYLSAASWGSKGSRFKSSDRALAYTITFWNIFLPESFFDLLFMHAFHFWLTILAVISLLMNYSCMTFILTNYSGMNILFDKLVLQEFHFDEFFLPEFNFHLFLHEIHCFFLTILAWISFLFTIHACISFLMNYCCLNFSSMNYSCIYFIFELFLQKFQRISNRSEYCTLSSTDRPAVTGNHISD